MTPLFTRCHSNPIITAADVPFPAAAVLNPGAAEQDGEVVLLLRVEDHAGYSSIYTARSRIIRRLQELAKEFAEEPSGPTAECEVLE